MLMNERRSGISIGDIWKMVLGVIGIIAVIQELMKPKEERTWHGKVWVFPYEYRVPNMERVRTTFWNPDGPPFSSKVFGVGWAPNFGYLARFFTKSANAEAGE